MKRLASCDFAVYGTELSAQFLEGRPVSGVILPAAAHDPGDFRRAAVWSRHAVSCNTSQRVTHTVRWPEHSKSKDICVRINYPCLDLNSFTPHLPLPDTSLYLSPPHHVSVGCSCLYRASSPWKRSPRARPQSSKRHSVWYSDLVTTAEGSIGKGMH